jgi:hypothetical protein
MKTKKPRLITRAQFARKIRKSRSYVTRLVQAGVISLIDGKIDPQKADVEIAENIDSRAVDSTLKAKPLIRRKRSSSGLIGGQSLTEVRRDHELLKKHLTELELEIQQGNLVPKEQPIQWLVASVMRVKNAFMNFPYRMSPVLVGLTEEKEIFLILKNEIWAILRELSKPLSADQKMEVDGGDKNEGEFIEKKRDQGNRKIEG